MMSKHGDEVLAALSENKELSAKELPIDESLKVIGDVLEKFTKQRTYRYPLWEHLDDWIGVDFKFSWEWFSYILEGKQIVLLFEPDDDERGIIFENGRHLVDVLNHCYRFTFYVTDRKNSFLFCYNDHDNLIAAGEGKEWLSNFLKNSLIETRIFHK
jgi:hypothetical protein